jgi:hypothetical protein
MHYFSNHYTVGVKMPEILSKHPVAGNKSSIIHRMSDGKNVYHCRTHQNPVAYGPPDNLKFIELDSLKDTSSKSVNGIWLRDKNIMSVGVRQDGRKQKYLGIRPDDNQTGSEQFEFSIERIEFDGVEIPVDVAGHIPIDPVTADLGNVLVRATRQGARQMVSVPAPVKHFRIIFTINFKGLDYKRKDDIDEEWFYSQKTGEFRLRLGKPLFIYAETYEPLPNVQHLIKHTVRDNHDGTLTYIKESTKYFSADLLPQSYLIDANTVYSSTADGYVENTNGTWSVCRSAASGNSLNAYGTTSGFFTFVSYGQTYYIDRSFFYFNTSSLSGSVTAVTGYWCSGVYSSSGIDVAAQKGTQADTLTTADFDSFSGSYYGTKTWPSDNTVAYQAIVFNAQGRADINQSGTTKICLRDYSYDYGNIEPFLGFQAYGYFSDYTGTSRDPYLSITVSLFKPKIIIF